MFFFSPRLETRKSLGVHFSSVSGKRFRSHFRTRVTKRNGKDENFSTKSGERGRETTAKLESKKRKNKVRKLEVKLTYPRERGKGREREGEGGRGRERERKEEEVERSPDATRIHGIII